MYKYATADLDWVMISAKRMLMHHASHLDVQLDSCNTHQAYVVIGDCSMFRRSYVQKVYVQKVLYSEGPMVRRFCHINLQLL